MDGRCACSAHAVHMHVPPQFMCMMANKPSGRSLCIFASEGKARKRKRSARRVYRAIWVHPASSAACVASATTYVHIYWFWKWWLRVAVPPQAPGQPRLRSGVRVRALCLQASMLGQLGCCGKAKGAFETSRHTIECSAPARLRNDRSAGRR